MAYWILVKHEDRHGKVQKIDFSSQYFSNDSEGKILVQMEGNDWRLVEHDKFMKEYELIAIYKD